VDSAYSHLAWTRTPRKEGGLGAIRYPLVADLNKSICRDYGVLLEDEGVALRGLCRVLDYVGIDYHLRDFDDVRAARGF